MVSATHASGGHWLSGPGSSTPRRARGRGRLRGRKVAVHDRPFARGGGTRLRWRCLLPPLGGRHDAASACRPGPRSRTARRAQRDLGQARSSSARAGKLEGRVRMHAYLGERMLASSPALAPLAAIAVQHHERLDGSGLPARGSPAPTSPRADGWLLARGRQLPRSPRAAPTSRLPQPSEQAASGACGETSAPGGSTATPPKSDPGRHRPPQPQAPRVARRD